MLSKRLLAEFIGTFVIVFSPVAISANHGDLLAASIVSGLAVLSMIYALGPISAAHFNPAVTVAFTVVKRFPVRYVVPYLACQIAGAVLAAAVAALLFGAGHGTHVPAEENPLRNLGTEFVITFILMLVIMAVATDKRVSSTVPALAIGFTVISGVLTGGPVTGGSMNPARSLGPALFAGGPALASLWIYLIAPPLGAIVAALLYESMRMDHNHSVGAPNELLEALEEMKPSSQ